MLRIWLEQCLGRWFWLAHRVWRRGASETFNSGGARACLNLGSAYHAPVGWLNLDRTIHALVACIPLLPAILYRCGVLDFEQFSRYHNGLWSRVRFWDVRYPLPFADNTFDYVYSSHLIEHLAQQVCNRLLRECYRVLKPGGVLRIVVPDVYLAASQYIDTMRRVQRGEIDESDVVSFLGETVRLRDLTDTFVGQFFEPDPVRQRAFGHAWMYDSLSLGRRLRDLGFQSVRCMQFGQGSLPDLGFLDTRPENSLHLEAVKAASDEVREH